jgi:hypothetical protein
VETVEIQRLAFKNTEIQRAVLPLGTISEIEEPVYLKGDEVGWPGAQLELSTVCWKKV